MRTAIAPRSLVALGIVIVLIASGCGQSIPSRSPGAPSASAAGPGSSAGPSVQPASPSSAAEVLELHSVAVTVSDRLRVRSEPRVSDDSIKYEPVLPLGTALFVLDGPVAASGYQWYKVAPVSFAGLDGPGFGWVAMADKDGTPWIARAEGPAAGLDLAMAGVSRAVVEPGAARRAAASINAFAVDLHRRLVSKDGLDLGDTNVVFSPTSITLALAMARAGARGETAAQIDRVLHTTGWDELSTDLNALDQALTSRDASWNDGDGTKELKLRLANVPFGQRGWAIDPDYLEALGATFGAGLRLVDYAADKEGARRTINAWVSDRTAGRIKELLSPADISTETRLTLVNAIYLKAQWADWFDEDQTEPIAFTRFDGSRVDVPMMKRWGGQSLPFAQGDGWKATQLEYLAPYGSPRLAMLLVRPDDLRGFEAGLTAAKLARITAKVEDGLPKDIDCPGVPADQQDAGCYEFSLNIALPRFSAGTRASLPALLQGLGMPLAFVAGEADFSGIHTPDPLFISSVIHEANIDVDEKGTEAAAATAVGMDTGGGPSPAKDIDLRFDRPFLFFVRDVETGAILFMGRVVDPSNARG